MGRIICPPGLGCLVLDSRGVYSWCFFYYGPDQSCRFYIFFSVVAFGIWLSYYDTNVPPFVANIILREYILFKRIRFLLFYQYEITTYDFIFVSELPPKRFLA